MQTTGEQALDWICAGQGRAPRHWRAVWREVSRKWGSNFRHMELFAAAYGTPKKTS